MLFNTILILDEEYCSILPNLNNGEKIVIPVILAIISSPQKPATAAPKNIKILLSVKTDFSLKDLDIMMYPTNKPNIHKIKKDLCINPPKRVMPARNNKTTFLRGLTSTPEFFITFSDANAETIAIKAIGPNGCVNSFWLDEIINKRISAPKRSVKPPAKKRDKNVTTLSDNGIKLRQKTNVTNNIAPTSKISCKWFWAINIII